MIAAIRLFAPDGEATPEQWSLREYYETEILPEIRREQAAGSLISDLTALNHWERWTGDPQLAEISPDHLARMRDGMQAAGYSPATVNKNWRELRAMLNWAVEERAIDRAPQISRRSKSKLLKEPHKVHRETLSEEEVTALWRACKYATYPLGGEVPAPRLWRVALLLWWCYGARTMDVVKHLTWDNIHFRDRLLRFSAKKTNKLQGLPLTPLVTTHLQLIQRTSHRIFPGFNAKGFQYQSGRQKGRWRRGIYATWRNEIQRHAGLSGIEIRHFRESMITRYNGLEPGLGGWIAGHYMPGVTAQNYDLPTKRIREAIESTPVPACFHELD